MALTRVETHLKMMNDIAKCKTKAESKKFRKEVLTGYINNPPKGMTARDIEVFQRELEKLKQER